MGSIRSPPMLCIFLVPVSVDVLDQVKQLEHISLIVLLGTGTPSTNMVLQYNAIHTCSMYITVVDLTICFGGQSPSRLYIRKRALIEDGLGRICQR